MSRFATEPTRRSVPLGVWRDPAAAGVSVGPAHADWVIERLALALQRPTLSRPPQNQPDGPPMRRQVLPPPDRTSSRARDSDARSCANRSLDEMEDYARQNAVLPPVMVRAYATVIMDLVTRLRDAEGKIQGIKDALAPFDAKGRGPDRSGLRAAGHLGG